MVWNGYHLQLPGEFLNMIIFCEDCGARYNVDLDNIKDRWHSFPCRDCGFMITVSVENPTAVINPDVAWKRQLSAEERPETGRKQQVLIVDDSKLFRRIIRKILESDDTLEVVGEAVDGDEALRLALEKKPDVITLDVNMPGMGGVSVFKRLMLAYSCPVVVVSNLNKRSQDTIIDFLRLGVVDFLVKPKWEDDTKEVQERFVKTVRNAAKARVGKFTQLNVPCTISTQVKPAGHQIPCRQMAVIVSGAGGISELFCLFSRLPGGFDGSVIVIQSMPEEFVSSLVAYMNQICRIAVLPLSEKAPILAGQSYIGTPEAMNQCCRRQGKIFLKSLELPPLPGDQSYKVDTLLCSIADTFSGPLSLTLLSGAECSLEALRFFKSRSGKIIIKKTTTCMVRHSLEKIKQAGLADVEAAPEDIVKTIIDHLHLHCMALPNVQLVKTIPAFTVKRRHQRIYFTLQTAPQLTFEFLKGDVSVFRSGIMDLSKCGAGLVVMKEGHDHVPLTPGKVIRILSVDEDIPGLTVLAGLKVEIRWVQDTEGSPFVRCGGTFVNIDKNVCLHLQQVVAAALETHLSVLSGAKE